MARGSRIGHLHMHVHPRRICVIDNSSNFQPTRVATGGPSFQLPQHFCQKCAKASGGVESAEDQGTEGCTSEGCTPGHCGQLLVPSFYSAQMCNGTPCVYIDDFYVLPGNDVTGPHVFVPQAEWAEACEALRK